MSDHDTYAREVAQYVAALNALPDSLMSAAEKDLARNIIADRWRDRISSVNTRVVGSGK